MTDELLAEAIANYMIVNGCASTTTGNRIFNFDDISDHFWISDQKLMKLKDSIVDKLYSCPQVCDSNGVWVDDKEFNLMFFLNYCNVAEED